MKRLVALLVGSAVLLVGCGQGMPGRGSYCRLRCSEDGGGQHYLDCLNECAPPTSAPPRPPPPHP